MHTITKDAADSFRAQDNRGGGGGGGGSMPTMVRVPSVAKAC